MSWLDEARRIAERKQAEAETFSELPLSSAEGREKLKKKLRMTYENATEREIEKALDSAEKTLPPDSREKDVLLFVRTKLED